MASKWIEIATSDGHMHSYLSEPDGGGPYPAVVVIQEAFGVNEYVRSVADRLADAGYVAIAPEIFHRTGTHVEPGYGNWDAVKAHFTALTNDTLEEDIGATAAWLRARPDVDPRRLAIMGFCVGGFAALLGGTTTAFAAVVAFYPGGVVNERPGIALKPFIKKLETMKAATLVNFGGDDQSIGEADRDAIKHALEKSHSRHSTMVWPGAKHGFHSYDRADVFNPQAAEDAWHKSLEWLQSMLKVVP
ncbi:MAG TPA: dienelactone hydrolase family protein [Kofleriaceae bacterium]|jgi:carboxymethylenebutenolidase